MTRAESLIRTLPDAESAQRFLDQLEDKNPSQFAKLQKKDALLSDVLTLVSFSPLLAATVLHNPEYLWWLERERSVPGVRSKEDLLESLARFALTHSQLEPHILLARFRRRELLRIFLSDIRRLATIAETTEDISNLADAILENALRTARQELDNRYGSPQETDERGRLRLARFCVVSLGKLGSRELNYSSDIDLVFLYSADGNTTGTGSRGTITNREYFTKLAEVIVRLIGRQTGEGAAYRVDLRLRPHGRVGALALNVSDAARYYAEEARPWERQVLIRSRGSAGDTEIFKDFFGHVEELVFSPAETVENALSNVRRSKQKIDLNRRSARGFDVKLDRGGIREIEFIAQALQLAYGGKDRWVRSPHTLISLVRLADRKLLSESELTALFEAYEFLRRLEHLLQMEHGLQTHTLVEDTVKRGLFALRMGCKDLPEFESALKRNTDNVSRVFDRVFASFDKDRENGESELDDPAAAFDESTSAVLGNDPGPGDVVTLSPRFADLLERNPEALKVLDSDHETIDLLGPFPDVIERASGFRERLSALRRQWQRILAETVALDLAQRISIVEAKRRQTALAEATIQVAIEIVKSELAARLGTDFDRFNLAVLGLGKLGGGSLDYDSDLDLVLVHDGDSPSGPGLNAQEFYSRAIELFITAISGVTRDGSLYRVDLRLRPYGKNGTSTISRTAFLDYMENAAANWELLAYVKLRGVGGDLQLAAAVENEIRSSIYERAAGIDPAEIAAEAKQIREQLEKERSRKRRGTDIDIKYGSGGMLDVYFAMRFLQLRDGVREDSKDRSTSFMLDKLHAAGSLTLDDHASLKDGYQFLSDLDHFIRLTIGRTTRLPLGNNDAMRYISERMGLSSPENLIERLTFHRLNIRSSYESILSGGAAAVLR